MKTIENILKVPLYFVGMIFYFLWILLMHHTPHRQDYPLMRESHSTISSPKRLNGSH